MESKIYRLSAHGNIIAPPGVPLHFPEHEAVAVFGAAEEYEAARRADPLLRMRSRLVASGVLDAGAADGDGRLGPGGDERGRRLRAGQSVSRAR